MAALHQSHRTGARAPQIAALAIDGGSYGTVRSVDAKANTVTVDDTVATLVFELLHVTMRPVST